VKYRAETSGNTLAYYQDRPGAPCAFRIIVDPDYVAADCFAKPRSPLMVPAKTLLSQLF